MLPPTTPPPTRAPKTPKPPKPTNPPKSVAPTEPPGPSLPNLIVTKFVTDAERVVVGQHTDARVTIKNEGTEDAGTFDVGISYSRDDGLGLGSYSGMPIDGLAAGESVQVTVNISIEVRQPSPTPRRPTRAM